MNVETGELYAVKRYKFSSDSKRVQKEFLNMRKEINLLRRLNHPNIVRYIQTDLAEDDVTMDVLLELVTGGSLKLLIQRYKALDEPVIRCYTRQMLEGLVYLHDHNVIHRDLKSANVLVTQQGVVKLTDFGSSKYFDSDDN
jgi:serine/threonine protein kinase